MRVIVCLSAALLLTAHAEAVTFIANSGTHSASVEFTVSGGDLHIHLVNTSTTPVGDNPDVLTAVFFDIPGNPIFTPGSIAMDATSFYVNTTSHSPTLPLADHWAYNASTGGSKPVGYGVYGVSACGFGIFNSGDTFTGSGPSPNGVDYGLVGLFSATASSGFKNQGPQVQSGVDIVLHGTLSSLPAISNVLFQYGSATNEPTHTGTQTPEPHSALLLLCGAAGMAFTRKPR
jgi:hypothetical protein